MFIAVLLKFVYVSKSNMESMNTLMIKKEMAHILS